jgi:hypothetical protein
MDNSKKPLEPKEKKIPQKKEKYDGHRWSSLILFLLTILAGVVFYLTGER